MSLTIGQIAAVSYPAVLADKRKAANQWAESALLHKMESGGFIVHKSLGATIEAPLDIQRNPGTVIQATELQALSLTKTEVVTAASYSIAEVTAPVTWSKKDEATNPSETQKIALVSQLIENGIESHDDILETDIFLGTTNGFIGLRTVIPFVNSSGSLGGIDPASNTFWRNQTNTYTDDTDIESAFTTTWNQCAKGSGAKLMPTLMVSDAPTQALFEGTQQALQRYEGTQDLKAGFKTLMFKTAQYVFSQYAGNAGAVYFLNPKNFQLIVSKEYFRDRGDTQEIENANGYTFKIYSALQTISNNRSRLGIAGTASSV
jgi:hypothetical protein